MTGAAAIAAEVARGQRSAVAVVRESLSRIEAGAPLNLVTDTVPERALARAAAIDEAVAKGQSVGPLAGVPFAVKNLFDVAGLATRAGSKINRDLPPAVRDAEAVARLEAAGAILVATTAMDEYAYGYTSENAHDGDARNPRDPARTPGGSSGGSAGAVAAGFVPIALGTDTNGSIRVPAALSGCFGLKPTFDRISRRGVFPFVGSLDHVGPFASSAADLALLYQAFRGEPDGNRESVPPHAPAAPGDIALRVGVAGGYFSRPLAEDVSAALARAASILDASVEVDLPEAEIARATGFVITTSEAGFLHRGSLKKRPFDFDPLIRDRLFAGALTPSGWYLAAKAFQEWYRTALLELFSEIDVLLLPATPCAAPPVRADNVVIAGETLPARLALGLFVQPLTITGFPIAVVPAKGGEGLPVGVQLMAAPGREDIAIRAASELESAGFVRGLEDRSWQ